MPVPKRRKPRTRTRSRKAAWFKTAVAPSYGECSQCRKPKLPHRACPNCGTYGGRQVLPVE